MQVTSSVMSLAIPVRSARKLFLSRVSLVLHVNQPAAFEGW